MSRTFTLSLTKIISGTKQPDTGRTVTLRDLGGSTLATATESPANSGQYVATLTETAKYGYWYVDGTQKAGYSNNSPFWLGNYDSISGSTITAGSITVKTSLSALSMTSTSNLLVGNMIQAASITATSITCRGNSLFLDTLGAAGAGNENGNVIRRSGVDSGGGNDTFDFYVGVCASPSYNYDRATMTLRSGDTNPGGHSAALRLFAGSPEELGQPGGHIILQPGLGSGGGDGQILMALSGGSVCAGAFYNSVSTLVDAATISTDASRGNLFQVTLSGNRTLGNPTNALNGQKLMWMVSQGAQGGPYTLAFGNKFKFGSSITGYTASTSANSVDYIGAIYSGAKDQFHIIAIAQNYK